MKKIITTLMLVSTIVATAQQKFTSYSNSYTGKDFKIDVSFKGEEGFTLYIDCYSTDKLRTEGGIMISNKQYDAFVTAIKTAGEKYTEWVETAKANNVKELQKAIQAKASAEGYFKYGKSWNFDFSVKLTFDFKIVESESEIKYLLIMRTGEMQSSSNQYIDTDEFVIVFNCVDDINKFLDAITLEKIAEARNKPKSEELFKD